MYKEAYAQRKLIGEMLDPNYELRNKPKKKFRFNKEKYRKQITKNFTKSGLDTSVVYITSSFNEGNNTLEYVFCRYFSTGVVFNSLPYLSMPSEQEFNDYYYGKFGMYTINDDGEILDEVYVKDNFTFSYAWSKVSAENIVTYKYQIGRHLIYSPTSVNKVNWIYQKHKVRLYARKVDW